MVKLRDLILETMTDEQKAEVKDRAGVAMTDEEIAAKFHEIETGVEIQMDHGDELNMRKVESIEKMSGDGVEPYRLIVLEDGDSVFVNDVMVGVTRQDDYGNLTSQSV